jgi:hypothetical protein
LHSSDRRAPVITGSIQARNYARPTAVPRLSTLDDNRHIASMGRPYPEEAATRGVPATDAVTQIHVPPLSMSSQPRGMAAVAPRLRHRSALRLRARPARYLQYLAEPLAVAPMTSLEVQLQSEAGDTSHIPQGFVPYLE